MAAENRENSKIELREVTKLFGPHPQQAYDLMQKGWDKARILDETGATVGVDRASATIQRGEVFVIMGLSGSGKSTLVRMLNRLIDPTYGQVFIDGEDIVKMSKKDLLQMRRKKMGMVFQRFALFPHRKVLQNVEYGLEVQGVSPDESKKKAEEALALVGLQGWEDQYPHQLSGGMQQRVGLARALANDPDVLLMDEAFSALDPLIRKEMQEELLELQNGMRKTIVFITHVLDEALKLGDRIAVMKDGRIVQVGTSEEILTHPADDYVAEFVQDVDRSKVLEAQNVMKKPTPLVALRDGPRVAIRKMGDAGISSIFAVDEGRKLKGLVTIDDCLEAVKQGGTLEGILIQDVPTTSPTTLLVDLIPIAAQAKYPIAVVDDQGTLKGILVRVSVLSGLALGKEASEA